MLLIYWKKSSGAENIASDNATLLEKEFLEENGPGWAAGLTEFEKEISSWANRRSCKGFS